MIGKTIFGYEDQKHKEIRLAMEKLGDKVLILQQQPEYKNALHQKIALLGNGYKELSEDSKKDIDNQIEELRDKLSTFRTDEEINKEIESIKTEIAKLEQEYYETPYILPPLYLKTRISYVDSHGTTIKALEDDPSGKKLYIYESSNYVTPHVQILTNEKNEPVKLKRIICNSETYGKKLTFLQDVLIDVERPAKPVQPPQKSLFPTGIKTWKCQCGHENYFELLQCPLCHTTKPVEENLEKKDSKKHLGFLSAVIKG